MNNELLKKLRDAWNIRANQYPVSQADDDDDDDDPSRVLAASAQLEFFIGAHYALIATGQHGLSELTLMLISVGRDINELVKD